MPHPLCRKASRKGDSVLLCYADIEGAIRKSLLELVQTSARRHGRGDGADRGIALRLGNQGLGKNICIAWRHWRSLGLLAAYHVEFLHAVIFILRRFCGRIALALLRAAVDQERGMEGRRGGKGGVR